MSYMGTADIVGEISFGKRNVEIDKRIDAANKRVATTEGKRWAERKPRRVVEFSVHIPTIRRRRETKLIRSWAYPLEGEVMSGRLRFGEDHNSIAQHIKTQ